MHQKVQKTLESVPHLAPLEPLEIKAAASYGWMMCGLLLLRAFQSFVRRENR